MALLARALDRDQHEVGLLIFNHEKRVHYQDAFARPLWFRALGLSRRTSGRFSIAMGIAQGVQRAVADFKPDLIHTSMHVANVAVRAVGLLHFRHIPVVTSIRCNFLNFYPRGDQFLEQLLCRRSSAIIVNSESIRQQLLAALRLPAARVVTIENGLDPSFCPGRSLAPAGWPDTGRTALVIGRMAPEKNHLALIEALKIIQDRGRLKDWNVVMIGEGPLRGQLEAASIGFPQLRLYPSAADLLPYYRNADLLLLPSLHEGMSNVALEAQACGVPVALTPGANASGVVSDGCGWLLEGELTESLTEPLGASVDELRYRGKLAHSDVHERFSIERLARQTEFVYSSYLAVQ